MPEVYGRHYRIVREPGGPAEIVHLEELQACSQDQSCQAPAWSVMAVSDDPMPCEDPTGPACFTLSISVQGQQAHLTFGMRDAATADVEVSYGDAVRGSTTTGEITLTLDRDPAHPGYLLLLFRDAQGQVFRAFGYTLGPGDSGAG
jgi:hypothetical protein